jgi:hypothetical protein
MNDSTRDQIRIKAHCLMEEALSLLHKAGENQSAALLDHAIAILGLRTCVVAKEGPSDER